MRTNRAVNQTWTALLLVLMTSSSLFAETWKTVTSGWRPSEIVAVGNEVYAASEGGVLRVDRDTGRLHVLNVDDGFSANFATTVAVDPNTGNLWIGYEGAALDIYNPTTRSFVQKITDFSNDPETNIVHHVDFYDNQAYVATNQGLSRLTYSEEYDTWVVLDTYRAFGPWPRSTGMRRSTVFDGKLFAGGEEGVAVLDIDDNPVDAGNWQAHRFVEDLEIPADATTYTQMLKVVDGNLYLIAYSQGYYIWQDDHFAKLGYEGYVFGLTSLDGVLYGATGRGLKTYDSGTGQFVEVATDFQPKVFDLCTVDNSLWLAMDTNDRYFGGIAQYSDGQFEPYYPNTPGGDQINKVATAPDGSIWASAENSLVAGYYRFFDGIWYPYAKANHPEGRYDRILGVTTIDFDFRGDTWIGTWGNGCAYITTNSVGDDTVLVFDALNSALQGAGDSESNYVVVGGFAADPEGGMWIGNLGAYDGHAVVYIPKSWFDTPLENRTHDDWVRYGLQQGLDMSGAGPMVLDAKGRLWIEGLHADSRERLTVLDPLGNPENRDDSEVTVINLNLGMDDYGPANQMILGEDGRLWLATPAGLYWVDTSYDDLSQVSYHRVYGILGESVNSLAVDPIGQLWIGTDFGISVLGKDAYTIVREYTTTEGRSPSPLVDDRVNTLAVQPRTGDVFIGTGVGMSVVSTPFRDFSDELGDIQVAPQPFLIGTNQTQNLEFGSESLVAGADVRIYTPSGRLVRELSFETAATDGWDGLDDDGDFVGSGVYLMIVTDSSGNSKTGKVAVVRR